MKGRKEGMMKGRNDERKEVWKEGRMKGNERKEGMKDGWKYVKYVSK